MKAERLWFPAQGASPNPITYRLLAVGSSSSATASSSGTVVVGRQISARTQTTSNWSGEIATGVHSEVGARWVVPAVSGCDPATLAYSDTWVGLGTNRIVQGGTFQTCDPSSPGGSSYTAWVEAYPAPSLIAYTVAAGDLMQAEASQEGATATITVTDLTSGSSITRSFPDATPLEGAEWIEEDPTDMTLPVPSLYPLADFGSVAFTSMSLDGGLPTATPAPLAQDFIDQTSLRLWAGSLQDRLVVRDAGS